MCYFSGDYNMASTRAPSGPINNEEKRDVYPNPRGCLMIFGGPAREVNVATLGEVVLAFLKWSENTITFDRKVHPNHIPQQGRSPLIIDLIIGKTRLS
jgi:hypothetical protein